MIGTRKYLIDASVLIWGFAAYWWVAWVKSGGIKMTAATYVGGNSIGIEEQSVEF